MNEHREFRNKNRRRYELFRVICAIKYWDCDLTLTIAECDVDT